MLLVKTKLAPSGIEGTGLFADEFIPKGTAVQKFVEGIDIKIPAEKVKNLIEIPKKVLHHFCYKHLITGDYILCADNARFLNHSKEPNLGDGGTTEEIDIALRDIAKGEELTVDYYTFDAEAAQKLSK